MSPVVRYRGLVVACWAAALALVAPHAVGVERVLETGARVEGSESARVEAEQVSRFGAPYAHYALLVVRGAPLPSGPEGRELIDSVASVVAAVPGVVAIRAYRDARDTLLVGRAAGGTLVLVGLDAALERPDAIVPRLRDATSALAGRLAARFPALTLRWTGEPVLNADLRQASAMSARAAERRALPMTLLLLVAAFAGQELPVDQAVTQIVNLAGSLDPSQLSPSALPAPLNQLPASQLQPLLGKTITVQAESLFCSESAWHIGDVAVPKWKLVQGK